MTPPTSISGVDVKLSRYARPDQAGGRPEGRPGFLTGPSIHAGLTTPRTSHVAVANERQEWRLLAWPPVPPCPPSGV